MIERTQALLDEILRAPDPVARNRLITACYLDLAGRLAAVLGTTDLNWFAFGAWASGTAGAAIRGEGLPVDLGTSENVAAGNLEIIRDVAPPFIRWLREIEDAGGATPEALARTLADPLFELAPKLAGAIRAYQAAHDVRAAAVPGDAAADKAAAELTLLANLLVGEHEQTVVDRFIDDAMPLGGPFGLITTRFISIETPDGALDVCRDVRPPGYLGGALFPAVLVDLAHPELREAFVRYGQAGTDARASNALSWEDYDDRMGYIVTFFRAYQRDARYLEVPLRFLPAEREPATST